jgi:hypothetical protein
LLKKRTALEQMVTEITLKAYCAAHKVSRTSIDYHIAKMGIYPAGSTRVCEAGAPSFLWRVKDLDKARLRLGIRGNGK